MSGPAGPLMLDVTRLVKKPPTRVAVGSSLVEIRRIIFGVAGMVAFAPITFALFTFGFPTAGILSMVMGAGAGLLLSVARPDGQTLGQYVSGSLRGRMAATVVDNDGNEGALYVGLCRVADRHAGQSFRLLRSAVEVDPSVLDERGAFKT